MSWNRLEPFHIASRARSWPEGATRTTAACRRAHTYEHLHAGRSGRSSGGEQQSSPFANSGAGGL